MKTLVGFLCILTLLYSATISGSIYSYESFDKVNNSIMKFEGPNTYRIIAKNGDYSIEVEKGAYNLTVLYFENEKLKYYDHEKIIVGNENQTFDIVVFPPSFFENDELPSLEVETKSKPSSILDTFYFLGGIAIIVGVIFFIFLKKYLPYKRPTIRKAELGEEETKVLNIIKENEGRIEQKQLREILNFSESKMSLIVAELEVLGYVKKFKNGRENIIKLMEKSTH